MNITEPANPGFPPVYLIDVNDNVIGGQNGISNRQGKQLVERTAYLKKRVEENRLDIDDMLTKDWLFPLGSAVLQYPWDKTPAARGCPGSWENWSSRAVIYGLSDSPPPPYTEYSALAGTQITQAEADAGFYALLATDGTRRIYKIKASFANLSFPYTVPPAFDDVKWESVEPGTRAAREAAQGLDFDSDLDVGDAVSSGAYAGKYVTEVLSAAGCFFGVEGGFRPAFVSGGVQDDAIRGILARCDEAAAPGGAPTLQGAFVVNSGRSPLIVNTSGGTGYNTLVFNANGGVPSFNPMAGHADGQDIRPRNLSVKLWLRIS
jgi:hypothetical protein